MKVLISLLLVLLAVGGAMAETIYLDEIYPDRIEGGEGGKYIFVYDMSKYKTPNWLPHWASESEAGIPSKDEIRAYLDSLPKEVRMTVDMNPATFNIDVASEYGDEGVKLEPTFVPFIENQDMPSVDMLLWRGKFSDDGLMAAFEYYDEYARPGMTRAALYDRMAQLALSHVGDGGATAEGAIALVAKLWAARSLAGDELPIEVTSNTDLRKRIDEEINNIKPDQARWKPISFYSWTPKLSYIYIRDRILCEPVIQDSPQAALMLAAILAADPLLKATYEAERARRDDLTGKPNRDFLAMFQQACGTDSPLTVLQDNAKLRTVTDIVKASLSPDEEIKLVLLPAASTPETRFMAKLMPDQLADFMVSFMKAIHDGEVNLDPGRNGPWYLFQQHALEPLLALDKAPESKKLNISDMYQERLDEAFQALYAAHRETHSKNAEMGGVGAAKPYYEYINKIRLLVHPVNRLEPLPEVYRLTAIAYDRLANILSERYDGGKQFHGSRPSGDQVTLDAYEEVRKLANLYRGFYLLACDDLGMKPNAISMEDAQIRNMAGDFLKDILKDGELRQDVRFLLPVGRGGEPGKPTTYYWAIGGIMERRLVISFEELPQLDMGKGNEDLYELGYESSTKAISTAQFFDFELPGTKSLNRDEFRALVNSVGRDPQKLEDELTKWAEGINR